MISIRAGPSRTRMEIWTKVANKSKEVNKDINSSDVNIDDSDTSTFHDHR